MNTRVRKKTKSTNKQNYMPSAKTVFISVFITTGIYLGINSLLAIPEIDEDKSKTKELSITLKEELTSIKINFVNHLNELSYDTSSLIRFDSINSILKYNNSSSTLKAVLNTRIRDQKFVLENQIDLYYYNYLNANLLGMNAKKKARYFLLKKFKDACSVAEDELLNNTNAVRIDINRLYAIVKNDTSQNYRVSKSEFPKLLDVMRIGSYKPPMVLSFDSLTNRTVFWAFPISNFVVRDESQTLAILVGLIGFGLLGAVIGTFGRSSNAPDLTTRTEIINNIYTTIIKSFSASILTYLSIKGGISVLTSNAENYTNPYFVLFVCFIAAVYSEDIWLWAKAKMFPNQN